MPHKRLQAVSRALTPNPSAFKPAPLFLHPSLTLHRGRTPQPLTLEQACYTVAFGLYHDDWTYLDAFYFTFDTFTTIGFGDLAVEPHPAGLCASAVHCPKHAVLPAAAPAARARGATPLAHGGPLSSRAELRPLGPRQIDRQTDR